MVRMRTDELSRTIRQTMNKVPEDLPEYPLPLKQSKSNVNIEDGLNALTLTLISASSSTNLNPNSPRKSTCSELIQRLEEHAKNFIAAENRAMSRAVEQRNALLDALIQTLMEDVNNEDLFEEDLMQIEASTSMHLINKIKPYLREYPKSIELAKIQHKNSLNRNSSNLLLFPNKRFFFIIFDFIIQSK